MPLSDTLIDLICYLYLPDQAAIIAVEKGGVGASEPSMGLQCLPKSAHKQNEIKQLNIVETNQRSKTNDGGKSL